MAEGWEDVAQICLNGHIITASTILKPHLQRDSCEQCGAETITACPHCHEPIIGECHIPGYNPLFGYSVPVCCPECGEAYPWAKKPLSK